MKKEFETRLLKLELESRKLCSEERFKLWLAEHYPNGNLYYADYMSMMPIVPEDLKERCLDQFLKELQELQ